jgi:hypothetical protein
MNPSVLSGVLLTVLIHGGLAAGLVAFSSLVSQDDGRPPLQMISIEAALATKGEESNQIRKKSQKARTRPETDAIKPADDATKVDQEPEEQPPPEPQEDFAKDFEKYRKQYEGSEDSEDDFDPDAEDSAKGGQFDGSEHGFAEVSKGDPYMQKLAADIFASWEVPTLEKGEGMAVGCVRLAADGSIVETELWKPTKNANIDRSVELALDRLKKLRKPKEAPVPVHLMDATRRWTCFNFPVNTK